MSAYSFFRRNSFRYLPLLFLFLSGCFFTVDWNGNSKAKEKTELREVPKPEEGNLSAEELKRLGKKPTFKSEEEKRLFELMTSEAGRNLRNSKDCSVLYNNCKDECWNEFPTPSVQTVFTAITVDRKRNGCIDHCRNLCKN
ncbi:hypothetical protein EHO60_08215 [Leptospira fletcheri]|uniref:Uncharacterized protein n=1 Tax=Leptospira fletcheri TaxID=2484981 RepID=A0A4R9GHN5_9LEPT|nr:hypothetical protein EHO60_08215 [Leptospira fletcheri]